MGPAGRRSTRNPDPSGGEYVQALGLAGSTLHIGGAFTDAGGKPRNKLAALDATTAPQPIGTLTPAILDAATASGRWELPGRPYT